jgi:hypothetical protein
MSYSRERSRVKERRLKRMKVDWKKVFAVGGIVATIIGAGFEMASGFIDLKDETKKPGITGPTDKEE